MEDKMRDKKDKAIVVVIGQITTNQAGQLLKEFIKVKQKYAPNGRGTIATGSKSDVGNLLQRENQRIKEIKQHMMAKI